MEPNIRRYNTWISACEKGQRQPALALLCKLLGGTADAAVAATADRWEERGVKNVGQEGGSADRWEEKGVEDVVQEGLASGCRLGQASG